MASVLELPEKSTRRMNEAEVRAEATRFGVSQQENLALLRAALSAELGWRWAEENREAIQAMNKWVEENGLPLEKYRLW